MEELQGFPFHQAEFAVFSLKVVFRAALWLEGSALPGRVEHPSTQMAAGGVGANLGFIRQVSAAQGMVRAGMGPS